MKKSYIQPRAYVYNTNKCEENFVDEPCVRELEEADGIIEDHACNESLDNIPSIKEDSATLSQWSSLDGSIIPVSNTFGRLERGYYSIHFSNQLGMYFTKDKVELNKLYRLPNTATDLILNDISRFWKSEETYKKYHRVFRRNYLLYSAPGTGKTSLINLMCEELIND